MDRAATTLESQPEGYIHTREARAYQQNAAETLNAFKGFGRPGIAKITVTGLRIPGCQGIAGRKIPQGENDPFGQEATATAQVDFRQPIAGWRECERLVSDPFQPWFTGRLGRLIQHRLHIVSVHCPRKKAAGTGGRVVVRLGPPEKVVRLVSQGTHVAGAHVQKQRTALRSIGQAAAHGGGFLDYGHRKRGVGALEKLGGQDRATKASADDGDGDRGRATLLGSGFHYAPWLQSQILRQYVYNVYYISRLT